MPIGTTRIKAAILAESARLSAIYDGKVTGPHVLILPQLRFELNDRRFLVTAMATSGHVSAGASGYSGPFTFVDLELPFDTAGKIQIVRIAGVGDQLLASVALNKQMTTGDEAFDTAFRTRGSNDTYATVLLSETVRQTLLNSHLPRLDIRVDGRKISVHMDGFAQSGSEIEELIEIAVLLADHFPVDRSNGDSS